MTWQNVRQREKRYRGRQLVGSKGEFAPFVRLDSRAVKLIRRYDTT